MFKFVFTLITALLTPVLEGAEGYRLSGDSLTPCDSATSDRFASSIFGDPHQSTWGRRMELSISSSGKSVSLFMSVGREWYIPAFRSKRVWWSLGSKWVDIVLYNRIHLEGLVDSLQGTEHEGGRAPFVLSTTAAIVSVGPDTSKVLQQIVLNPTVFPPGSPIVQSYGDNVTEIGIVDLGPEKNPVMIATMKGSVSDEGGESYTEWDNAGFWHWWGGRFTPLSCLEIAREQSEMGECDRMYLESSSRVEDVDGDSANEFVYSRKYIFGLVLISLTPG